MVPADTYPTFHTVDTEYTGHVWYPLTILIGALCVLFLLFVVVRCNSTPTAEAVATPSVSQVLPQAAPVVAPAPSYRPSSSFSSGR